MLCQAARILSAAIILSVGVSGHLLQIFPTGARPAHVIPLVVQPLVSTVMWTRYWAVQVRDRPAGAVLASLDIDQEVLVTGAMTVAGARWVRVRLWDTLDAWVRADLLTPSPIDPGPQPPGVPVAPHPTGQQGSLVLHASGAADGEVRLRSRPTTQAPLLRVMPTGTRLHVVAWATDSAGLAWYQLRTPRRWLGQRGPCQPGSWRGETTPRRTTWPGDVVHASRPE